MPRPFLRLQKENCLRDDDRRLLSLSVMRQKSPNLLVIPGFTRNPIYLNWIPAFAEKRTSGLMFISVGRATLVLCSFVNKRIDDMERRFELDERKNHNP